MENLNNRIKTVISKNEKYQAFINNTFVEKLLESNSLVFKDREEKSIGFKPNLKKFVADELIEIFNISERTLFLDKFNEAVSGDGRELNNMLTMWSSSLCALLCFYNISEKNPLNIKLNGENYSFTRVHFEIKNKVFKKPSNMDVVLIDTKKEAILFIESKFAEYLANDNSNVVKKAYINFLEHKNRADLVKKFKFKNDSSIYHYGIKQLLAHYIGLTNFISEKYNYHKNESKREVYNFYKDHKESKIFLLEIAFCNDKDRLDEYFNNLNCLVSFLNTLKSKINVLSPITYDEFFEDYNGFNKQVKEFYNFKTK